MRILGIETSCDETAAAVVEGGCEVLSDVVASQIAVHSPYGGVVPELASRKHVEAIIPVVARALEEAGISMGEVDAVAVTQGPGLVGALLVGLSAAKALCYAHDKPLLPVNHLQGHLTAAFFPSTPPQEAFICLIVSGGHTTLYLVTPDEEPRCVGTTLDDAAGEAFDKVAKILGLGYPGGVVIDRLAKDGNPAIHRFPRAFLQKESLDFSFSGIKTAVANFIARHGTPGDYRIEDLAAGFQDAVVDVLVHKTIRAAERFGVGHVGVAGGVAANSRLRERMEEETSYRRLHLHLPPQRWCTDNAVMIAAAGYHRWRRHGFPSSYLEIDAMSRWI